MVGTAFPVKLLLILLIPFVSARVWSDSDHGNVSIDREEAGMRALIQRRLEKRDSIKGGVLISTSYRCRSNCRCAGIAKSRSLADYVVCADTNIEATDAAAAQGVCRELCPMGVTPQPTPPECQPLNTQCKKARCP